MILTFLLVWDLIKLVVQGKKNSEVRRRKLYLNAAIFVSSILVYVLVNK